MQQRKAEVEQCRWSCRAARRRGNRLNQLSNLPRSFWGQLVFAVATAVQRTIATAVCRSGCCSADESNRCSAVLYIVLSWSAVLLWSTCWNWPYWYMYWYLVRRCQGQQRRKNGNFTTISFRAKTRGCYPGIPWEPRGCFSLIPSLLNEHIITCRHISRSAAIAVRWMHFFTVAMA